MSSVDELLPVPAVTDPIILTLEDMKKYSATYKPKNPGRLEQWFNTRYQIKVPMKVYSGESSVFDVGFTYLDTAVENAASVDMDIPMGPWAGHGWLSKLIIKIKGVAINENAYRHLNTLHTYDHAICDILRGEESEYIKPDERVSLVLEETIWNGLTVNPVEDENKIISLSTSFGFESPRDYEKFIQQNRNLRMAFSVDPRENAIKLKKHLCGKILDIVVKNLQTDAEVLGKIHELLADYARLGTDSQFDRLIDDEDYYNADMWKDMYWQNCHIKKQQKLQHRNPSIRKPHLQEREERWRKKRLEKIKKKKLLSKS